MNLFIIEEDPVTLVNLRIYLKVRFGLKYKIFSFLNSNEAIRQIDSSTNIVILDYDQGEVNGYEVYKSIKKLNSNTEVILLSTNEEIGDAIEQFEKDKTAHDLPTKKIKEDQHNHFFKFATYPFDVIVNEFGVSKYLVGFIISFIFLGIVLFVSSFFMV